MPREILITLAFILLGSAWIGWVLIFYVDRKKLNPMWSFLLWMVLTSMSLVGVMTLYQQRKPPPKYEPIQETLYRLKP